MQNDPIVDEIRRIREDFAKQFNYDVRAMAEDLRKSEQRGKRRLTAFDVSM